MHRLCGLLVLFVLAGPAWAGDAPRDREVWRSTGDGPALVALAHWSGRGDSFVFKRVLPNGTQVSLGSVGLMQDSVDPPRVVTAELLGPLLVAVIVNTSTCYAYVILPVEGGGEIVAVGGGERSRRAIGSASVRAADVLTDETGRIVIRVTDSGATYDCRLVRDEQGLRWQSDERQPTPP